MNQRVQRNLTDKTSVYPGNTYDYSPFNASVQEEFYNNVYGAGNCVDRIKNCASTGINEVCSAADNFCAYLVESLYDNYLGRDEYDMRELTPDPFPYVSSNSFLDQGSKKLWSQSLASLSSSEVAVSDIVTVFLLHIFEYPFSSSSNWCISKLL